MSENQASYQTKNQAEIDRQNALREKYEVIYNHYIDKIIDEVEDFGKDISIEDLCQWNIETIEALSTHFQSKPALDKITIQSRMACHVIKLQGLMERYKFTRAKMIEGIDLTEEDIAKIEKIVNA